MTEFLLHCCRAATYLAALAPMEYPFAHNSHNVLS